MHNAFSQMHGLTGLTSLYCTKYKFEGRLVGCALFKLVQFESLLSGLH